MNINQILLEGHVLARLCTFFDVISRESVRAFIIFLLVHRVSATMNSQKNNKIIERLPWICSSKNVQSRVAIILEILAFLKEGEGMFFLLAASFVQTLSEKTHAIDLKKVFIASPLIYSALLIM